MPAANPEMYPCARHYLVHNRERNDKHDQTSDTDNAEHDECIHMPTTTRNSDTVGRGAEETPARGQPNTTRKLPNHSNTSRACLSWARLKKKSQSSWQLHSYLSGSLYSWGARAKIPRKSPVFERSRRHSRDRDCSTRRRHGCSAQPLLEGRQSLLQQLFSFVRGCELLSELAVCKLERSQASRNHGLHVHRQSG